MKKLLLLISYSTIISSLLAHEFWLHPNKFIYNRAENINIRFFVGENFSGENWKGNNEKIQSLRLYYGGVSDDLSSNITESSGDSLQLTMVDEGTCLIAFNSTNSYIELEAQKFNSYLEEDGLANALNFRKDSNETDSIGREYYQRCAKTLVQVGPVKDRTYSIETGLPIDIIPTINPYALKNNDSLGIKILYQELPLTNTLIKLWHRVNNKTEKYDLLSDENGEIVFPLNTTGKWMVSVVKMERLNEDPKAQWQSYWGTFTWGYE